MVARCSFSQAVLVILLNVIVAISSAHDDAQQALRVVEVSDVHHSSTLRVAVIGAGAAGSSAAYHLSRFSSAEFPVNITIFDAASRIGGRTTTVNAFDSPDHPVELGASIFLKINRILYNATKDFELITTEAFSDSPKQSNYDLGVWDGSRFVFSQSSSDGKSRWRGLWDIVKLLWKYGLSPIRTQRLTANAIGRFLKLYEPPCFPFANLTKSAEAAGLLDFTSATGEDMLRQAGVGMSFARDIVQASTRVNYAQNLAAIHGLDALVCMATEGAIAVQGGNWQIFDRMVNASRAAFRLQTRVTEVQLNEKGTYTLGSVQQALDNMTTTRHYDEFDTVILAAPFQFAGLTFTPALVDPPTEVNYVALHVTLFTSPHRLSPTFFNISNEQDVPDVILTTLPTESDSDSSHQRGVDAVGPAEFWSVSMLRSIQSTSSLITGTEADLASDVPRESKSMDNTQYLYKIFSPHPIRGMWLARLLGFKHVNSSASDPISNISKEHISWVHEKLWHSYPYEVPRESFEMIRLLDGGGKARSGGRGIWYTAGIESFISTMETSALMGMNVARLICDEMEQDSIQL